MASLTAFILVMIYQTPSEEEFFRYDPRYAKLVPLQPHAMMAKTQDIIAQRTCFEINDKDKYSKGFTDALQVADQAPENQVWADDTIPSHDKESTFDITTKDALGFLEKYNFTEHVSQSSYQYICFFNYQQKQYVISFTFDREYAIDGSTVTAKLVKDNDKTVLTNPDITVYSRFNGTVLFHNSLDHDVVLTFTFRQPESGPDNIRIPPGQTLPYPFGLYPFSNSITYQYLIKPDNLQGTVTVKNPEAYCIGIQEAKSLYSQVNVTLKFPQYLPSGYEHKCSAVVLPNELISFYAKNNTMLDNPIPYLEMADFHKSGGLRLDYMKTNSVDYNQIKATIEETKKDNSHATAFDYTEINGNPARIGKATFIDTDLVVNQITIYTKDSFANITGNFTVNELVKIAQSLDEK